MLPVIRLRDMPDSSRCGRHQNLATVYGQKLAGGLAYELNLGRRRAIVGFTLLGAPRRQRNRLAGDDG